MGGHKFTTEEAKAARKRQVSLKKKALKIQREMNVLGFSADMVNALKDVIVELIRASQANPLVGITVSLVAADILYRTKIIGATTTSLIYGIIGTSFGLTALQEVESLVPFLGKQEDAAKLLVPSPTTLTSVQAEQKDASNTDKSNEAIGSAALGAIARLITAAA